MEEENLIREIEKQCQISSSQQDTLFHCHFAREDEFLTPSPTDDIWPEFSSPSTENPPNNTQNDVVGIRIVTPPETPESQTTSPEIACSSLAADEAVSERGPPVKKLKLESDVTVTLESDDDDDEVSEQEEREYWEEELGYGGDTEEMPEIEIINDDKENEIINDKVAKDQDGVLKCFLDAMKIINNASRDKMGDDDDDEEVDILETVKLRGMTFPRNRWYDFNPE